MEKQVQTINSLSRGLLILDIIHEHGTIGVTELSKMLGVNKSSAYRLLRTLEENGYVEQVAEGGKYALGLKMLKFRERVLDSYEIRTIAHPYLEELTRLTGEAAGLSVLKNDVIYLIDCCSSPQYLGVILQTGDREEIHSTAHGKAMFAAFSEEEQKRLLLEIPREKHTGHTIVDAGELLEESVRNKKRGYAVDDEETTLGMRCVAAPIFDFSGEVKAAIGISGPTDRVTKEKIQEYAETVCGIAAKISKRLGY